MEKRTLVQVTRYDSQGNLLYGWKQTGLVDPIDQMTEEWFIGGTAGDTSPAPRVLSVTEQAPVFGTPEVDLSDDLVLWLPEDTVGPAGYERWYMNQSFVGTKSGDTKGRWGVCYTCLEEFPTSELVKIKGHWYCSKNKCKEDFE